MSRTKDQWIEETGGRQLEETEAEFRERYKQIRILVSDLLSGKNDEAGLERIRRKLCELKGIDFDEDD